MAATKRKNFNYLIATSSFIVIVSALIIITHNPVKSVAANQAPVPTAQPQQITVSKDQTATITMENKNSTNTHSGAIAVSGTSYYLVGGSIEGTKKMYSKPVLLGEKINITSVLVQDPGQHDNGMVIVNFMAANSTATKTVKYSFQDNGELIKVLH